MNAAQQFEAWRAEVVTERDETKGTLTAAHSALSHAQASHAQARAEWHDLNNFAAGALHGASDGMAAPLRSRVLNMREALDLAERTRGAALATVESLEQRVADLQLAVDQIDRAISNSKVTPFPRVTEPSSRRKHAVVEFDNILPREAL
jgi:hypothetical protein